MLAPWAATYIGLPWLAHGRSRAGVDCWGLVRLVLADVYGVALPSYAGLADLDGRDGWPSIEAAIAYGLAHWQEIPRVNAEPGDGVVLRLAGQPLHVGLIAGVAPLRMLHAWPGVGSCLDRLDALRWARRLAGFYRCRP